MPTRRTLLKAAPGLSAFPAAAAAAPARDGSLDDAKALIDRYAAAWASGDVATSVACYHDDFTLHYFGRNALTGDHVGKAAALKTLGEMRARTKWRVKAITGTMAGPGQGAITAKVLYGAGPETLEMDRVLIFAILDGKLRECWAYDQDQRRLDAFIDDAAPPEASPKK